jgi:hypothetical protein
MRSASCLYESLHFTVTRNGTIGAGPVLLCKQLCGRWVRIGLAEQVPKIQHAKSALEVSVAVRHYRTSARARIVGSKGSVMKKWKFNNQTCEPVVKILAAYHFL